MAREAIDQMLAGTGLAAALDEKTGAFAIRRDAAEASQPDVGTRGLAPTAASSTMATSTPLRGSGRAARIPGHRHQGQSV